MLLSSLLLTYLPNLIWDHDHDEGPDYDEVPAVSRKLELAIAMYTLCTTSLSLCRQTAKLNPFRGIHCTLLA